MAVWYLDNDDEITDAVARLRGADDEHVVFVVPPGSRIATGRMNFKLLAREAENRALHLAIASPDEQVRALAASAGVLAAVTPDEAEAALERGDEAPASTAPPAAPTIVAGEAGNGQTKSGSGGGVLMWRSQRLRVTTVVVLIAVIIGGYATLQTVPTAEVTLSPRLALLGPLETTISASAETSTVDPSSSTVPATVITVPLSVQDGYPASGVEATETRATGEVVFSATDQEFDQEIAAGTRVLTPSGIAFQTTETVVLPRGDDSASEIRTPVEALESGESGNVPAEAISIVPSLESQGIGVVNPEADRRRPLRGGAVGDRRRLRRRRGRPAQPAGRGPGRVPA